MGRHPPPRCRQLRDWCPTVNRARRQHSGLLGNLPALQRDSGNPTLDHSTALTAAAHTPVKPSTGAPSSAEGEAPVSDQIPSALGKLIYRYGARRLGGFPCSDVNIFPRKGERGKKALSSSGNGLGEGYVLWVPWLTSQRPRHQSSLLGGVGFGETGGWARSLGAAGVFGALGADVEA